MIYLTKLPFSFYCIMPLRLPVQLSSSRSVAARILPVKQTLPFLNFFQGF